VRENNRCDTDWQGPSDEECVDDLLVISCEEPWRHEDLHHGHHPDTDEAVMWVKGTANLLRVSDGSILQKQFDTPDGEYHGNDLTRRLGEALRDLLCAEEDGHHLLPEKWEKRIQGLVWEWEREIVSIQR